MERSLPQPFRGPGERPARPVARPQATAARWLRAASRLLAAPPGSARRFSVGVSGTVVDARGHVLLLRHAFRRRHPWGLVSGWVEPGEAPADAMRRELREESSLCGEVGPILAIRADARAPSLEVVYLVRVEGGTFRPSMETPEAAWFDLRGPLPDALHPTHRPLVALAARAVGLS